jgi:hypothetical protein
VQSKHFILFPVLFTIALLGGIQSLLAMQIRNKTQEDIKYHTASRVFARRNPLKLEKNGIASSEWVPYGPRELYVTDATGQRKTNFAISLYPKKLLMDEKAIFDIEKEGDHFVFNYVPGTSSWINEFFKAVRAGDIKAAQQFLEEGMNPNIQDKDGKTGLMIADELGNKEMASLFPQPAPEAPPAPFPSQPAPWIKEEDKREIVESVAAQDLAVLHAQLTSLAQAT